jgi:hypothetical protein
MTPLAPHPRTAPVTRAQCFNSYDMDREWGKREGWGAGGWPWGGAGGSTAPDDHFTTSLLSVCGVRSHRLLRWAA